MTTKKKTAKAEPTQVEILVDNVRLKKSRLQERGAIVSLDEFRGCNVEALVASGVVKFVE